MRRFFVLHARMQSFFKAWDLIDEGSRYACSSANIVDVEFLRRLQASLGDPIMDDDELRARLEANLHLLEAFARTWQSIAASQDPTLARFVNATSDPARPELDVSALRLSFDRLPA